MALTNTVMVPSFQFHLISAVSCALFPSCSLCSSPASYFHRSRRVCVFLVLPLNLKTTSSTDEDLPASSTFGSTLLVQVRHNQEALNQRSFTLTVINPWHIFNDAVSHDTTSIFFFYPLTFLTLPGISSPSDNLMKQPENRNDSMDQSASMYSF